MGRRVVIEVDAETRERLHGLKRGKESLDAVIRRCMPNPRWGVDDLVKFVEDAKTQGYGMGGKTLTVDEVRALLDVIKSRVELLRAECGAEVKA